jgi:hypothetical protein
MDFAAAQAKQRFNQKHRALEFAPGDKVYLRLHDGYHLPGKPSKKYSQQRSGPWTVKRRVGALAYELDFPENSLKHPIISMAQLRSTPEGNNPFDRIIPPPGPVEAEQNVEKKGDLYEVKVILQHRPNRKKDDFDYLIKWKG